MIRPMKIELFVASPEEVYVLVEGKPIRNKPYAGARIGERGLLQQLSEELASIILRHE